MNMNMNKKKARLYIYSWDEVPLFVDIPFCSKLLGICCETIRQKCANGKIRALKTDAGWRISKETLMEFYEKGGLI